MGRKLTSILTSLCVGLGACSENIKIAPAPEKFSFGKSFMCGMIKMQYGQCELMKRISPEEYEVFGNFINLACENTENGISEDESIRMLMYINRELEKREIDYRRKEQKMREFYRAPGSRA